MSQHILEEIQYAILITEYDLIRHARIKIAKDELTIFDIEHAILSGHITGIERDNQREPRYTIKGLAEDRKREVTVVGCFTKSGRYLIIRVYKLTELEG
ncbi:MAG: DUF4258 domain-containing protein [Ardenticatenaceae bacterium]